MSKKARMLLIIAIVVIVIVAIILIRNRKGEEGEQNNIQQEKYTVVSENGDKRNTSEALREPREELGYNISNITLEKKNTQTIFKIKITNGSTTDKEGKLVDIVFTGENGEEEARMALYIRAIKAGQSIETQATIDNDFTNVYNFRLEER